jgi:7-cyano-7-deazaguanine synthase in queuosine biosynthesis
MNHVVLYSGGPDSFITLQKIIWEERYDLSKVTAVYFDLGHRYRECERRSILKTFPPTIICNELESLGGWEESDAFIWHRNAFLCLGASKFSKDKTTIHLTVQKDELSIVDRKPEFLFAMENLFFTLGQKIIVSTPWIDMDKTEMVSWYLSKSGNPEALKDTWSCYKPRVGIRGVELHCGDCPACIRRYISFSLNDIYCSESWMRDPKSSPTARKYVDSAVNGDYSSARNKRILSALG